MPHSSGGFSGGGGGFHGGSGYNSGSNTPSTRTSTRPFNNALMYVYYTRSGRARVLYSNATPASIGKGSPFVFIILGLFFFIPFIIAFASGFNNPVKLKNTETLAISIEDNANILSTEDEAILTTEFISFKNTTGIPVSILTEYQSNVDYLEDYAYDKYIERFSDESHWLLVFTIDSDNDLKSIAMEGMQGNDTDGILTEMVGRKFTKEIKNSIYKKNKGLKDAIIDGFNLINPTIMEKKFDIPFEIIIFFIVWEIAVIVSTVVSIVGLINNKHLKNAYKGSPTMKKLLCPNCMNPYYEGTVTRCPKCGESLTNNTDFTTGFTSEDSM